MAGVLTVGDVFDRVKRTFGDESSAQVTEDDILRWINDAQREAIMQNEGLNLTLGYLDLVAGQAEYDLPANLFTLHHVWATVISGNQYYKLSPMPLLGLDTVADGWDNSDLIAYPMVYSNQQDGKLLLFPKPQASVASGIKLNYSAYAEDVVDVSSTLKLPPYFHSYIVNYCLMQGYEMDEDWESATHKAQQVQGDLDFNANKKFWFGRDSYPNISVTVDDQG
jgi:hypothetical protein